MEDKRIDFDQIENKPTTLIDESINEIYETLYSNGLELISTDGTTKQKEMLSIHLLAILSKDLDLLVSLMFELGDVADREYKDKPQEILALKQRLIKLFDYMEL
ncbi:hypothetical protein [Francisella frigiditurris]|uniref:Uncharacterized protein n=1 Tax=Francisella frigiditurris TaxID=1542390 RepID=A0A1J0KRV4_9GAMM|nr:hypothetical protein [Francisella frigiditurris]APC96439.1 hypothetical protein KX01_926 [Francisella frigiditurris]